MNFLPLLLLAALGCASAHAQLDRILAPINEQEVARHEATVVALLAAEASPETAAAIVAPERELIRAAEVSKAIAEQAAAHFKLEGDLRVSLTSEWKPISVSGTPEIVITEFPANGLSGSFIVRLRIAPPEGTPIEKQVHVRAQLWQEVWTAAGRLNRGEPLDRALLAIQKIDVLAEREAPLPASAEPERYDVAQSLAAGRPLTTSVLEERPVVRKGRVVEVVATSGLLVISMKALALENGCIDQFIQLRNLESRKEFTAQIIHENRVQVHF